MSVVTLGTGGEMLTSSTSALYWTVGSPSIARRFGPMAGSLAAVAGVELSLSGGQLSASASAELVQPFTLLSGDKIVRDEKDNLQTRVGQLFLATARLGYSWDRWLAYGKGGFASAEIKIAFQATVLTTVVQGVQLPTGGTFAGQSSGSSSDRHSGWTLGGAKQNRRLPELPDRSG
jgi:hypothetical protein